MKNVSSPIPKLLHKNEPFEENEFKIKAISPLNHKINDILFVLTNPLQRTHWQTNIKKITIEEKNDIKIIKITYLINISEFDEFFTQTVYKENDIVYVVG